MDKTRDGARWARGYRLKDQNSRGDTKNHLSVKTPLGIASETAKVMNTAPQIGWS